VGWWEGVGRGGRKGTGQKGVCMFVLNPRRHSVYSLLVYVWVGSACVRVRGNMCFWCVAIQCVAIQSCLLIMLYLIVLLVKWTPASSIIHPWPKTVRWQWKSLPTIIEEKKPPWYRAP
jgi:hypothetical protein